MVALAHRLRRNANPGTVSVKGNRVVRHREAVHKRSIRNGISVLLRARCHIQVQTVLCHDIGECHFVRIKAEALSALRKLRNTVHISARESECDISEVTLSGAV